MKNKEISLFELIKVLSFYLLLTMSGVFGMFLYIIPFFWFIKKKNYFNDDRYKRRTNIDIFAAIIFIVLTSFSIINTYLNIDAYNSIMLSFNVNGELILIMICALICTLSYKLLLKVCVYIRLTIEEFKKNNSLPEFERKVMHTILLSHIFCLLFRFYVTPMIFIQADSLFQNILELLGIIYALYSIFNHELSFGYKCSIILCALILLSNLINAFCLLDIKLLIDRYPDFSHGFYVAPLLIIYPIGEHIGKKGNYSQYTKHFKFLYVLWSLVLFVTLVAIVLCKGNITLPWGTYLRFRESFLEIGTHYNIVGMHLSFYVLVGLLLLILENDRKMKITIVLSMVINYLALCLTNSRTSIISCCILFSLAIASKEFLKNKNIVKSSVLLLAVSVALYYLKDVIISVYSTLINSLQLISESNIVTSNENNSKQIIAQGRKLFDENTSTLNGRTSIWEYSLKGFLSSVKNILFGVTRNNYSNFISEVSNGKWISPHSHNQIVEFACDSGVFSLATFVVWITAMIKNSLRIVFNKVKIEDIYMILILGCILLNNMMGAHLIYDNMLVNFVFCLLMGVVIGKGVICKKPSLKNKEDDCLKN